MRSRRWKTSRCRRRLRVGALLGEDIIEPEVTVSSAGEIAIPDTPGRGYEVRTELVERLTVRKETIRAVELVS